jgi:hypothetical protein
LLADLKDFSIPGTHFNKEWNVISKITYAYQKQYFLLEQHIISCYFLFLQKQVGKQDLVLQLDVIFHLFGYFNKGMWINNLILCKIWYQHTCEQILSPKNKRKQNINLSSNAMKKS